MLRLSIAFREHIERDPSLQINVIIYHSTMRNNEVVDYVVVMFIRKI